MQKYYRLKIQHDMAEKFFIQSLLLEIKKITNSYLDFFFTRKEKQQVPIIEVYIDKKFPNSQIIMLENVLQQIGVEDLINCDFIFSDTEGNFGLMGDLFLSNFYKETNETAIKILEKTLNDYNSRLDIIIDLLLISAHHNYKSITNGYMSFASHVNGFFTRWKDPITIEEKFNKSYLKNKSYLFRKIKTIIDDGQLDKNNEAFKEVILNTKRLMIPEINKGKLNSFDLIQQTEEGNRDFLAKSPFHNAISENSDFLDYMNNDKEFLSSRLITVFTYLLLKNLGLKNMDRYLLCYYIYRAVEETYNLDTLKLIRTFKKESDHYANNK